MFYGLFVVLFERVQRRTTGKQRGRERREDMQQRATGRIQTRAALSHGRLLIL